MIQPEVFTNIRAEHAEGPVWDPVDQCLYWVDIMRGKFYKAPFPDGQVTEMSVDQPIGVLALRNEGGLVLGLEQGFAFYDPARSTMQMLPAPPGLDPKEVRMNDGAVDPRGRFFAGTMDYKEHRPVASLYGLDTDHSIKILESDLTITNGMGWSPDRQYFFMIDTPTHCIFRYQYDEETGLISAREIFKQFESDVFPDGMTIDAKGHFWVAIWGGFRVVHLDENGNEEEHITLPVPHVTSCCFGGPELQTLFITTSQIALNEQQKSEYPQAGRIFAVKTGHRGMPEPRYAG